MNGTKRFTPEELEEAARPQSDVFDYYELAAMLQQAADDVRKLERLNDSCQEAKQVWNDLLLPLQQREDVYIARIRELESWTR